MSLEGLDGSVLAQLANMDAHVCAAGGKRVIALPVHVQSRSCRETETKGSRLLQHRSLFQIFTLDLYWEVAPE